MRDRFRASKIQRGVALLVLLGCAVGLVVTLAWTSGLLVGAPFDDAEAQLRIRQAAAAASAAAREVEALRQVLEAERSRVGRSDRDREYNRSMIDILERKLRDAEAELRKQEGSLAAARDARDKGLPADSRRTVEQDQQRRATKTSGAQGKDPRDCEELRKALEAERARVVQTEGERQVNRSTIDALEKELGSAETSGWLTCPEMVPLPPGSFMMGPAPGEEDREGVPPPFRVGPTHRVTIGYSFSIGKYEITRAEYAAFVGATNRPDGGGCSWRNPGFAQTDRDPVVCVSWEDASAYVAWLSRTTGKTYRLPSEAEWEYAARAGSQAARYWGDSREEACRYGNFADLTGAATLNWEKTPDRIFLCFDGYAHTAPVGKFKPNDFGLHDMLGNAWEWVDDCYNSRYDGAPVDGRAWLAGNCGRRMLRGGSWYNGPRYARAAFRHYIPAGSGAAISASGSPEPISSCVFLSLPLGESRGAEPLWFS